MRHSKQLFCLWKNCFISLKITYFTIWGTPSTEALRQQQAEVETSLYRLRRSSQLGAQTKPSTTDFRKQFEYFIDISSEHEASIQAFMQCMHTLY
jgi:hypothetical protein